MTKVGVIQMTSGPEPEHNLSFITQQLDKSRDAGIDLVLLPENALVCGKKEDYHQHAEPLGDGVVQAKLSVLAQTYQTWLVVGSMPIRRENGVTTTTLVYSPEGRLTAHYDKLHMFDVDVADAHARYRESETFMPGNHVVLTETPLGKTGLSICYDLRFPHLYAELRRAGAEVILVPAAFTATTGRAHWETLLKARAIETQCWIIAANQGGVHQDGRETWGHSMVINPWGEVVAELAEGTGMLTAILDHKITAAVREKMPLTQQARFSSVFKNEKAKDEKADGEK
ncbi:amidohydrolase [Vibrio albus]|uniref:Amidohydrolase n=1 Tax=Vibrio albus TaxID=2200953 RepID=A0A2U3BD35_9VIBR|nr:carbon-nitrogen hydrolase family protein [Vibrio albus]PWI34687.1 amidohydrolase [Vibrio albus]